MEFQDVIFVCVCFIVIVQKRQSVHPRAMPLPPPLPSILSFSSLSLSNLSDA